MKFLLTLEDVCVFVLLVLLSPKQILVLPVRNLPAVGPLHPGGLGRAGERRGRGGDAARPGALRTSEYNSTCFIRSQGVQLEPEPPPHTDKTQEGSKATDRSVLHSSALQP